MDCWPAMACSPMTARSLGGKALAGQPLGMACCKERMIGVRWHMSVSYVKTGAIEQHQFGGNRHFRKARFCRRERSNCYPALNQADLATPCRTFPNRYNDQKIRDNAPLLPQSRPVKGGLRLSRQRP